MRKFIVVSLLLLLSLTGCKSNLLTVVVDGVGEVKYTIYICPTAPWEGQICPKPIKEDRACTTQCSSSWAVDIGVEATPTEPERFAYWDGACTGSEIPCRFKIGSLLGGPEDKTVKAVFVE